MNKLERMQALLNGGVCDRPPFSFWHHFRPDEVRGVRARDAHLRHFEHFDLDFLKVMNDNGYPRLPRMIQDSDGLDLLESYRGDEGPLAHQLELIYSLRTSLGKEALLICTVFSPWTVLRSLTAEASVIKRPPSFPFVPDERDRVLEDLLHDDRGRLGAALETIAYSLKNFAHNCLDAGADGIFLSVRDDWIKDATGSCDVYSEIVRSADHIVLEGASGGNCNMLHVCGQPKNFEAFAAYPVQLINWADRHCGPAISEVRDWLKPIICAGLDNSNTLNTGTVDDCRQEILSSLAQARRPMILAPGCTYDPEMVPDRNLLAIGETCKAYTGQAER